MESNLPIGKETEYFVKACQAIHALLACAPLHAKDRDIVISTANALLIELKAQLHQSCSAAR